MSFVFRFQSLSISPLQTFMSAFSRRKRFAENRLDTSCSESIMIAKAPLLIEENLILLLACMNDYKTSYQMCRCHRYVATM